MFFSASIFAIMWFLTISSSALDCELSATLISLSSFAAAARSCASRFRICCSRSASSARRSSALVSCCCRSNSTTRSPAWTVLPGRTSRGDHERLGVRTGETGRGDGGRLDRLDRAAEADATHEVAPADGDGSLTGVPSLDRSLPRAQRPRNPGTSHTTAANPAMTTSTVQADFLRGPQEWHGHSRSSDGWGRYLVGLSRLFDTVSQSSAIPWLS